MRKNKKLLLFFIALAVTVVTAFLVFPYFKEGYLGETKEVVVAIKDIKEGEKITGENIKEVSFPVGYYDTEQIVSLDEVTGQFALGDIYKKDVITARKISDKSTQQRYVSNVTAITVKTLSSGAGGNIKAGDRVKIYGSLKESGDIVSPSELSNMVVVYVKKSYGTKIENETGIPAVIVFETNNNQAKALIALEYQAERHLERLKASNQ